MWEGNAQRWQFRHLETADCELSRANTKETRPLLTMKNKRAAITKPGMSAPALRSAFSTPNARTILTTSVETLNKTCTGAGRLRVRQKHCTRVARTPTTKNSLRVICAIAFNANAPYVNTKPCPNRHSIFHKEHIRPTTNREHKTQRQ